MTAIESKEEISDTDSGIILHSGEKTSWQNAKIQHMISIKRRTALENIINKKHNKYCWCEQQAKEKVASHIVTFNIHNQKSNYNTLVSPKILS